MRRVRKIFVLDACSISSELCPDYRVDCVMRWQYGKRAELTSIYASIPSG